MDAGDDSASRLNPRNALDTGRRVAASARDVYEARRTSPPLPQAALDERVFPAAGDLDLEVVALLRQHDHLAEAIEPMTIDGLGIDADAVEIGRLLVAGHLHGLASNLEFSRDPDLVQRMENYLHWRIQTIHDLLDLPRPHEARFSASTVLTALTSDWSVAQRTLLLIELAASNPFEPFDIALENDWRLSGLTYVAELVGLFADDAERVTDTFAEASRAHTAISATRVGAMGIGIAAAAGVGGLVAAPAIGTALGGAAGLSGAAATAHGLGLLGTMAGASAPGSLVTGGMWLVAQASAMAGLVAGAGGTLLFELGAARTQAELIKLQTTYKLILLDQQRNEAAVIDVLQHMEDRIAQLESLLDEERSISDPDSPRVTELEASLDAARAADSWMNKLAEIEDDGSVSVRLDAVNLRLDRLGSRTTAQRPELHARFAEMAGVERDRIEDRIRCRFRLRTELDQWDVTTAVAIGITAAVLDACLLDSPSNPLTARLRAEASTRNNNWLANVAKVPFDQSMGEGFTPMNHRALTPGHDPLLGFVFGTRDILASTMTRSDIDGCVQFVDRLGSIDQSLTTAAATQLAHLLSDVATPAGLPLPGWAALTLHEATAARAVEMYRQGYDTWHLAPMTLPVAAIHGATSVYFALRSDTDFHPDRREGVRYVAHLVAATGDLAALLATSGNPLVINYALWLQLVRLSVKRTRRRMIRSSTIAHDDVTHNQHLLNHGWTALLPPPAEGRE